MNQLWFWWLAGMLIVYALLDGYDLGVGALYLWLPNSTDGRPLALAAIGPVWNGNEVWLIAAGGLLIVSFPRVYALGFSGFYLALMLVLWFFILRGVAIEFRDKLAQPLWRDFWDAGFGVASMALALLLGIAVGNLMRGLPIGKGESFQGTFALLLNPYALSVGLLSLTLLAWHGANYLRIKTLPPLQLQARLYARRLYLITLLLTILVTVWTFAGDYVQNLAAHRGLLVFPIFTLAGLALGGLAGAERDRAVFFSSMLVIAGLLGSAAATLYPTLLRSSVNPAYSLTIYNAASSPLALKAAFIANAIGLLAVVAYLYFIHRTFSGKVRAGGNHA